MPPPAHPAPPNGEAPALVVNAGSSSLKLRLLPRGPSVLVARIGDDANGSVARDGRELEAGPIADVPSAFRRGIAALADTEAIDTLEVVGHRVVHGGRHRAPLRVDASALAALEALVPLAPLHNPANLAAIAAARERLPGAVHVAVFDTAFHASLPRRAYLYPLPYDLVEAGQIRRYGFHGTSHDAASRRVAALMGRERQELRIVTLHLGNGASAAAVDRGRSIDTTMGFTPMEGLMMGTRSGDLDPGILLHLLRQGRSPAELDVLLNHRSGLLGLSGVSNDLRDVRAAAEAGEERSAAALEVYDYRIRKTIGGYAAAMGGLDAIAFTGGVGENDARTRWAACEGLDFLGIELDASANERHGPSIGRAGARVQAWVVPADEEARIAELARAVARGEPPEEAS